MARPKQMRTESAGQAPAPTFIPIRDAYRDRIFHINPAQIIYVANEANKAEEVLTAIHLAGQVTIYTRRVTEGVLSALSGGQV